MATLKTSDSDENTLKSMPDDSVEKDIYFEIQELKARGEHSLGVALKIAIAGVVIIVIFSMIDIFIGNNIFEVKHLLIRASSLIFTEMLAYFFYDTYRDSHQRISVLINEKINIEMKRLAMDNALKYANAENTGLLNKVIDELAKTERNFILDKGKTTVDLEKFKITSKDNIIQYLQKTLDNILKNKKNG